MENPYINSQFFQKLETRAITARKNLEAFYSGKHQTNKYGQTVEFSEHKEYVVGDDLRKIDWNLYSRFNQYYIKYYKDEQQIQINIYLDISKSMTELKSKRDYAIALAAGLGYLGIINMDKIKFYFIKNNRLESSDLMVGKEKFFKEIKKINDLTFGGESYISEAIMSKKSKEKGQMAIIISDFLTANDYKRGIDYLAYNKQQIVMLQLLAKEEISPNYMGRYNLIDSEALAIEDIKNLKLKITQANIKAYDKALAEIIEGNKSYAKRKGYAYAFASTDLKLERLIFSELMMIGVVE